jgi:alpha-L-fucosidase
LLLGIGSWLAVNGEAIYGTRPWKVYGEGPTRVVGGSFNDTKRQDFTGRDIRFTQRGDTLYAIVLAWPENGSVVIKSLASDANLFVRSVAKVELPGESEALSWTQDEHGLHINVASLTPREHAFALRITPEKQG